MKKADSLHYGELVLDETCLFGSRNGELVHFTRSERALLLAFCRSPRRLMSRNRLLDEITSSESGSSDRNIDFLINRLRAKLGDSARSPMYIATQYGEGYIWIAEPSVALPKIEDEAPFIAILPAQSQMVSVLGVQGPALLEQFREMISEGLGPHKRVRVLEHGQSYAATSPRYFLRLSFHGGGNRVSCTATLQEMPSRRIMKAFSSNNDASAEMSAASCISVLSGDVIAYMQNLITSMTAGLGVPPGLPMEEHSWNASNRLTTGSYQMWLAMGEQLGKDLVSDTSTDTALQWCMHLFSRLVLASPFSSIDFDERQDIESEMEATALRSMPVVENNPVQMLAVAKLLYFVNRGHLDLAQDIAERAAAQMTGSPAPLALLAQIYSALGQSSEAFALLDRGIAMAGSNLDFLNHMKMLKCIAFLAAGDSQAAADIMATIDDLGDHCPPDVAVAIRLMAALTDRQLPDALADALASAGPLRAGNVLEYLYFTSARQHASATAYANLMRGLTTHVTGIHGELAVPAFLRSNVAVLSPGVTLLHRH